MKRLRIIHVLHRMGAGGTELALRRVVAGLDPELFENIICTVTPNNGDGQVPGARMVTLSRNAEKTGSLVADLSRLFLNERPDVVHSRNWGAIEAVVAAKLARIPRIVHSEHGRDIHTMNGDPWRRRVFRRFCYAMADQVFAVSGELREHYAAQLGLPLSKLEVIPNGVETNRFRADANTRHAVRARLSLSEHAIVAGTVGRLDPVKDHSTLLQAAEELARRESRVHVIIVGGGPEYDILQTRIDANPVLRNRVQLVGESDRPEDWLNAFDVFVLPSLSEGMSNTILEAMATELPCVVTSVGANPDLVQEGQTGFLVEPRDAAALADRIMKLAEDASLRSRLGRHGRSRVKANFSMQRMIENYSRLYAGTRTEERMERAALSRA